jgi:4-oxalocrotonate tautomerase
MPIIRVEMLEGRTIEQKRELVEVLTRETVRICKCPAEAITVLITDFQKENWGSAGRLRADPQP